MATNKHRLLFERLHNKTNRAELNWGETLEPDRFMVSFKDFSVTINPVSTEDPETDDYLIRICNASGDVVDSFTDNDIGKTIESADERSRFFKDFSNLFEMARRNARGADVALDSILQQLGDDADIPF